MIARVSGILFPGLRRGLSTALLMKRACTTFTFAEKAAGLYEPSHPE